MQNSGFYWFWWFDDLHLWTVDCCIERLHKMCQSLNYVVNYLVILFFSHRGGRSRLQLDHVNPVLPPGDAPAIPNMLNLNGRRNKSYSRPQDMKMQHVFWTEAPILRWAQCVDKIFHWYLYCSVRPPAKWSISITNRVLDIDFDILQKTLNNINIDIFPLIISSWSTKIVCRNWQLPVCMVFCIV